MWNPFHPVAGKAHYFTENMGMDNFYGYGEEVCFKLPMKGRF